MFDRIRGSRATPRGGRRTRPAGLGQLLRKAAGRDPLLGSDDVPGAEFERTWKRGVKQRTFLLLTFMACWVACIEARLVHLQVVLHEDYSARAESKQRSHIPIKTIRGDITDRSGRLLAYSVEVLSIAADPSLIKKPEVAVADLCKALGDCNARERGVLLARLSAGGMYAPVRHARTVTPDQIARVKALGIEGIFFERDSRRFHPLQQTAAHVVGSVNADNQGQAGVEYSFNKLIRGINGRAIARINRSGQRLMSYVDRQPVPGASLELTIDATLQHIAERELQAGVQASRAQGGTVVIMNPHTGEVLAMASYPTFNPNAAGQTPLEAQRNRAVQDTYEPGSTFKIVTASAAIQEGVVRPDDLIDTSPGYIVFGGRKPITDTHSYGVMTFEDVIVKSSNVGAIKAGLRVGADRLTRYVHNFGFGQPIATQFAGESRGIWSPANLTDSRLASLSMGYEIGVTPLQMATAVSAVANGGKLLEPRISGAVIRHGRREEFAPKVVREAITRSTADTVTAMMEGVVERGTARTAQLPGYRIAGKTGTASKAVPGGYSRTDYNASFVGFLPSRNPAFTILVVIDSPKAGSYYGGVVAAPVFKRIAEAAVLHARLPPTEPVEPSLLEKAVQAPAPARVPDPMPLPPPVERAATTRTASVVLTGGPGLMPDLTGLPAREALRRMSELGLTVRVSGEGFVTRQTPAAGAPLNGAARGSVELRRVARAVPGREP